MSGFVEVPASSYSWGKRKLVVGIGINDADYLVRTTINGKIERCPFYTAWESMLTRCYSPKFHKAFPTYAACSVCPEWLVFSAFRSWMMGQEWRHMNLDKDIKKAGNKLYSPETCLFIPCSLNLFLMNRKTSALGLPPGVTIRRGRNRFRAAVQAEGKRKYLGYYSTREEAHKAYVVAKNIEIERVAALYPEWEGFILQHRLPPPKESI